MSLIRGMALAMALAGLLGASGCAQTLACEKDGGAPWLRVRSPHIVLDTNSSRREGERVVRQLEKLGDALALFLTSRPLGLRMHLVMFHDELQFRRFFAADVRAVTMGPAWFHPEQEPLMVVAEENMGVFGYLGRELLTDDFVHEATHRILLQYAPQVPRWVNEGLARLCSTMTISGGKVVIGKGSSRWWSPYPSPTLREILDSQVSSFIDPQPRGRAAAYYLASWTLIHMLLDNHPKQTRAYLIRLSSGDSHREAWQAAFGNLDIAMLGDEFEQYRRQGFVTNWRFPVPDHAGLPVEVTPLADRDVHLLWLRLVGDPAQYETRVQLQAAAAHLPADDPELKRYQIGFAIRRDDNAGAEAAARALLAIKPESAVGWEALALLAFERMEHSPTDARARLAEVLPHLVRVASTPRALALAARSLFASDQLQQAIPFARRAVDKDEACAPCLETLGTLLYADGNKVGALQCVEAAAARAPDDVAPWLLRAVEAKADAIRKEIEGAKR